MEFVIFGKPNCQFCEMSKQLLTMRNKQFESMTKTVVDLTGVPPRTFPQILSEVNGEVTYVGGFTELRDLMAQIAE
ncbi:glutaredoxin [Xanthomonadaceae bacterium JHOS43]|nr:glutaredoxin [Xanthomonadaceae bacterium JHOS43]